MTRPCTTHPGGRPLSAPITDLGLVKEFGRSLPLFDAAFSEAWYKLTTRDMGPRTRCIGDNIPPAKPWQYPLPPPPPPAALPDFGYVRDLLALAMTTPSAALPPDEYDGAAASTFTFTLLYSFFGLLIVEEG